MSILVIDSFASAGDFPVVDSHDVSHNNDTLDNVLTSKVDKVSGKSLSDNNFSDADVAKLGGIESGANKTITDTVLNASSSNPVSNSAVSTEINKFNSWFTLKEGV